MSIAISEREESDKVCTNVKPLTTVGFVVSGDYDSAMGFRARAMSKRLSSRYSIKINYRSPHKVVSILRQLSFLMRIRPVAVYLFDISYTGLLAAGCYKFLVRNCLIVETGDAIAELVRSSGSRGRVGLWLTRLLENTAFRIADRVVVRGSFHKKLLALQGIEADVIQDGVDPEGFRSEEFGDLRKQYGLDEVTTIGLVGSSVWSERLQMCYGWELVETLRLLRDQPVKGIMIGGGSGIAHLKARCREYGLEDKLLFLGHVPFERLPVYLRLIDICLSTQSNDIVGQVRTTGKLPLYLAAGRYVLASKVGEASIVLNEEMLVEYEGVKDQNYPQKLAARIETILGRPEMLKRGLNNVALAKEYFDYTILAQRMNHVIAAALNAENASA